MIKVLHKAFTLLELIGHSPETAQSLTELSEAADLNQPTTARILKDLVDQGYVEQVSRSKGYILGPMAYQISSQGEYKSGLLEVAKPLITACAREVKQSVLLSTAGNGRRYILFHENHNPNMNIKIVGFYFHDFFMTATGRILMAYMPDKELDTVIERNGLPEPADTWEKVTDIKSFKTELTKIRQAQSFIGSNALSNMTVMACPVFKNQTFMAALGASMPIFADEQTKEQVFNKVKQTAEAITLSLSTIQHFG